MVLIIEHLKDKKIQEYNLFIAAGGTNFEGRGKKMDSLRWAIKLNSF